MRDILLIDDDGELVTSLARVLSPLVGDLSICASSTPDDALEVARTEQPKVVVLDLCLHPRRGVESGFELLELLRRSVPHSRVIVVTGHGSREHGIRALSLGASSFIEKPADPAHLAALIRDAATQSELLREYAKLCSAASAPLMEALCGSSEAMRQLRDQIAFLATTPQSVLIVGETGTGKGLCARLIHEQSSRRKERFVHYQPNFAGGDIVHSELFGHVKGAFTGAVDARRGLVVEAHRGTLFIDELDEVPPDTQVKLLDLVQERRVRPLGADVFHAVDCRFIAATNRSLDDSLASGKIRRDLHHRLAHNVVRLPPLRTRRQDVPELAFLFLKRLRERDGLNVFEFADDVLFSLSTHEWPGNVRELQGVVETAAYHAHFRRRSQIEAEDLSSSSGEGSGPVRRIDPSFHDQVERFKVTLIEGALVQTGGNQVHAARLLGLDRSTLRRVLARGH